MLSILALGALLTAGAEAAFRLRGYAVFNSNSVSTERSASNVRTGAVDYAFIDDAPAQVEVEIGGLQGDANPIRTLNRAPIPTWPQRTGTALILFAWLIAFAAQWAKRPVPTTVRWLAIIGGAVPVFALCSSWCFSGWVDPDVITQTARETISLELSRDQVIRAIRLPNGAWSGSLGSTAAVLVFPLIAFGLCILAQTESHIKT